MQQPTSNTKKKVDQDHHQCEWRIKYESVKAELASLVAELAELTRSSKRKLEGILGLGENGSFGEKKVQENDVREIPHLPPEMWERVFANIKDPKDWLNCYNTCPFFRDIMGKDKVAALLPSVIQIMSDHPKRYYSSIAKSKCNRNKNQKNVELTPHDLRTCRLVCKSWRAAIDNHVSNHPSIQDLLMKRGYNRINYEEHFASALPIVLDVENSPEKVINILSYLDATQPKLNLLSSRHLVLKGLTSFDAQNLEIGKHPVVMLLERVGSSIWHFAVDNEHEGDEFYGRDDIRNWWDDVNQCLSLLPNLRSLYIFQPRLFDDVLEPQKRQVRHFPDLTVIQFFNLSENIYKSILRSNCHIKKLTMHGCGTEYEGFPRSTFFKYTDLSKLEEFSMGIFHEEGKGLGIFSSVKWPLKKVSIYGDAMKPQVIFIYLKRFRESLTHFHADNLLKPIGNTFELMMKAFPKLSKLELALMVLACTFSMVALISDEDEFVNDETENEESGDETKRIMVKNVW